MHENAYHVLTGPELRDMFAARAGLKGFDEWVRAFHDRKYDSDFSREMTRSVEKALESFGAAGGGDPT